MFCLDQFNKTNKDQNISAKRERENEKYSENIVHWQEM